MKDYRKHASEWFAIADEADSLNPYAVDTRYPVYYPSISPAQAHKAVNCAEVVKIFIRERVNKKA